MNEPVPPILARIESARHELRPAEKAVADFVFRHPHRVTGMSIAAVARASGVSEPSVARFCRALGCSGFKGFKILLAKGLAVGVPYVHADVSPYDEPIEVSQKVIDRTIASLAQLREHLEAGALAAAVERLAAARRIEFYGQGNSGIVAADAQHKFFRLGVPSVAYSDPHVHAMAATLLGPDAAVVAISARGRTLDLLASVELARKAGAAVIGITAGASPLAQLCTVVLAADVVEDATLYSPMTSRIAHLALIDALSVSVALARGPAVVRQLEAGKKTLSNKQAAPPGPHSQARP